MLPRPFVVVNAAAQVRTLIDRNPVGHAIEKYLDALEEAGVGSRREERAWAVLLAAGIRLERTAGILRRQCVHRRDGDVADACPPLAFALARERERLACIADRRPGRIWARLRRTLDPGWGEQRDAELRHRCLAHASAYLCLREACDRLTRALD